MPMSKAFLTPINPLVGPAIFVTGISRSTNGGPASR